MTMTTYELKTEKFQGPLEKLLELIEEKKLEISEISLAEVTADFLEYLKALTDADSPSQISAGNLGGQAQTNAESDKNFSVSQRVSREMMRLVADFIAVASRLVLIKSKSLLPGAKLTADEETEIRDLEERLKLYRALKPAMKLLNNSWQKNGMELGRPYFLNALSSFAASGVRFAGASARQGEIFYPGSNLSLDSVTVAAEKIADVVRKLSSEEETLSEEIVSVEKKIKEILERLQKFSELSFKEISGTKPRSEIIAAFLAILHMAHEQVIFLEQRAHFSDIMIKKQQSSA